MRLGVANLVLKKVKLTNKLVITIMEQLSNPNSNVEFLYNNYVWYHKQ